LKIAIIGGSGKMGRWFARQLKEDGHEVVISGRDPRKLRAAGDDLGLATADNVSATRQADVVLLSVAIDSFTEVVRELGPHITPEQTVIDITSVKEMPVAAMHRHLRTPRILGTHPLFGPGAKGLSGQNFALTPAGEAENALADKVTRYLQDKGAQVTVMTPQEHDAMMTVVLGLAHFIAIVAADTVLATENPRNLEKISGVTYKVLFTLIESVLSEDPALYAALQMHLPGVGGVEKLFREKAGEWADIVARQDRGTFIARMTALKKKLEKDNPDFGKAYENMYRIADGL